MEIDGGTVSALIVIIGVLIGLGGKVMDHFLFKPKGLTEKQAEMLLALLRSSEKQAEALKQITKTLAEMKKTLDQGASACAFSQTDQSFLGDIHSFLTGPFITTAEDQLRDLVKMHDERDPKTGIYRHWFPLGLKDSLDEFVSELKEISQALGTCQRAQALADDSTRLQHEKAEIEKEFRGTLTTMFTDQIATLRELGRQLKKLERRDRRAVEVDDLED